MARRVVVHIGLANPGTTFLQLRLDASREQLAEQDVLFPGPALRRHANVRAGASLLYLLWKGGVKAAQSFSSSAPPHAWIKCGLKQVNHKIYNDINKGNN